MTDDRTGEDLAKELRDWAHIADHVKGVATLIMLSGEIFNEAADEIEQLRIGYQQAMSELEKVIAERDSLRRAGDELHRALGILADPDDYNWRTLDIEYLLDRWARVIK